MHKERKISVLVLCESINVIISTLQYQPIKYVIVSRNVWVYDQTPPSYVKQWINIARNMALPQTKQHKVRVINYWYFLLSLSVVLNKNIAPLNITDNWMQMGLIVCSWTYRKSSTFLDSSMCLAQFFWCGNLCNYFEKNTEVMDNEPIFTHNGCLRILQDIGSRDTEKVRELGYIR